MNLAELARRHAEECIIAFLSHELSRSTSTADELCALADLELDVVDRRTNRDVLQRKSITDFDISVRAGNNFVTNLETIRCEDVALLTVHVVEESDACAAVRVVLDGSDASRDTVFRAFEVAPAIKTLMAATLMAQRKIDFVFVGCDRVAANGDVANKIGTHGVAIVAKYFKVPLYVFAPTSTIDLDCVSGSEIIIEERPAFEVTDMYYSKPMAPKGVRVYNPAFDVTPASLISGIVTEKGILKPREIRNIAKLK